MDTQGTTPPRRGMLSGLARRDPVPPAVVGVVLVVLAEVVGVLLAGGVRTFGDPGWTDMQTPYEAIILASLVARLLGTLALAYAAVVALAKLHDLHQRVVDRRETYEV